MNTNFPNLYTHETHQPNLTYIQVVIKFLGLPVKEFFTFETYIITCFVKKQPAIIIIII